MFNATETVAAGNGLEIFDTGLKVLLGSVIVYCLWRWPRPTLAVAVGLVVWFAAGPNASVVPWLAAVGLGLLALLRWAARLAGRMFVARGLR